jgi:hypothetical protein
MALTTSKIVPYQQDRSIEQMFYRALTAAPPLWPKFMSKTKFPKGAYYKAGDMAGLSGAMPQGYEGEAVQYDVPTEGNVRTRYPVKFHKGFQYTEEAQEDDYFGNILKLSASLSDCARYTIETQVATIFNNPTSTTYAPTKDGLAMAANAHYTLTSPATNGFDNYVSADLDTTSLQACMQFFQTLKNEEDMPMDAYLKYLMVSIDDQWKAQELLKSTGRVFDTGPSSSNPGYPNKGLVNNGGTLYAPNSNFGPNLLAPGYGYVPSWDVIVNRFLTDADSWFGLSNLFDGQVMMKRDIRLDAADDLATGNRLYRCSLRFKAFVDEWRGVYCSVGA